MRVPLNRKCFLPVHARRFWASAEATADSTVEDDRTKKGDNLIASETPLNTEPRAVATGCKQSTNLVTSLMNQLSLGSGRYHSRFCIGWHSRVQRTRHLFTASYRVGVRPEMRRVYPPATARWH